MADTTGATEFGQKSSSTQKLYFTIPGPTTVSSDAIPDMNAGLFGIAEFSRKNSTYLFAWNGTVVGTGACSSAAMSVNSLFKDSVGVAANQKTAIVLMFLTQLDNDSRFQVLDFIGRAAGLVKNDM